MPGQEFSYNKVVGERSLERGFQIAKVYQSGKVVDGLGGGICQTSSTLYNAVLYADLEITERRNHSLPVSYVNLGRDATVVYGTTDFRFKNNQKTPIKIDAKASGGVLTVKILGFEDDNKKITLKTETVQVRPFTETIIQDTTIPVGSTQITQKGSNGYIVKTYKITTIDGVTSEPKLISTDTYAPIVQIKKIGVEPTMEGL
jgi:vancomycin resistance protein YoaR